MGQNPLDNTKAMKKLMEIVRKKYSNEKILEYSNKCGLTPHTYVRRTLLNKFLY